MRTTGKRLTEAVAGTGGELGRLNRLNLLEFLRPPPSRPELPPEKDPNYLESLPPRFVVHTVHGTFAKRAGWVEKYSRLCDTLRRQLGWRARIEPFRWSDASSIKQRTRPVDDFRRHLLDKLKEFPHAHHVVIAHRHGGNVAFWAIKDKHLAQQILGVATVATPVLSAHAHSTEASPSGTWRITQFEADREPRGLFHSQAYQNPLAQLFIAKWVLERAWSAEAVRS